MNDFSDHHQDTIKELFNLGMGRAAAALSELLNEEVGLSVPRIEFAAQEEAARRMSSDGNRSVAVRQSVRGGLDGNALLVFPRLQSFSLINAILGSDSRHLDTLADTEAEALSEVGNILINNCIGIIADMIDSGVQTSLPEVLQGTPLDILRECTVQAEGEKTVSILVIEVEFSVAKLQIAGQLVFLTSMDAINRLVSRANAQAGT